MGRISPGPTRWPPGAERRLVPAKSNLKPQTHYWPRGRGVGVCVWAQVWAAPCHSWLGCWAVCVLRLYPATPGLWCALWVCVFGLGLRLRPATPGWGVGLCVCSACTQPLLARVRGVGVCVWARVSAAPYHSWLGCWAVCVLCLHPATPGHGCAVWVCVFGLGFRLRPATPGWGVGLCVCSACTQPLLATGARCGCVCLGSGFGCAPPLLAGVLGRVCAPLAPSHFWPRMRGVGVCVWAPVLAAPPLLAGVLGCVRAPLAPSHSWPRVRGVGVCVWARVSAAPHHSWLECWAVCVLRLHPATPGHGCAVWVCVFGLGFRLRPTTPGWGVGLCVCSTCTQPLLATGARCGSVCLGSGFGCAHPLLAGVLGCVCAPLAPSHSWPRMRGVGVCVRAQVLAALPLLAGVLGCVRASLAPSHSWPRVRGVGVCVWAQVSAAPRQSWLECWAVCVLRLHPATPGHGCAVWVCVFGLGFRLRPTTPGWGVGLCVCSACTKPFLATGARCGCVCLCSGFGCAPPLLAGVLGCVRAPLAPSHSWPRVRSVGVCVWARVSAAPRHSWLGCWAVCVLRLHPATPGHGCAVWVCVFGLGFRLRSVTPCWGVGLCVCSACTQPLLATGARCGCVCLGSGFGCAPPLLAGVLGCVCAPLAPSHSWPRVRGVGVCVWARVLAAPRHSWLGCWAVCVLRLHPATPGQGCAVWVCVFGLGFRLRPATPGWGVGLCVCSACTQPLLATDARCGCVCLGSGFGCAPPLLVGLLGCVRAPLAPSRSWPRVRGVGVCVWARVSAAPRHSWLGCWAVCVLRLHPATTGHGCAVWVCVFGLGFQLRPATPGWGVGLCACSACTQPLLATGARCGCVCLGSGFGCAPPLLAGVLGCVRGPLAPSHSWPRVRGVGVCVWARVSAAPRHSWLGCWAVCVVRLHPATPGHGCAVWVCVFGLGFPLRPATPGWGVGLCTWSACTQPLLATGARCGCVCLGSGFGCSLSLLAGVLGCVCAPLAPSHSWPRVRGVGVCVWARVSAAPRHSWLGCWAVCVLCLHPATPGCVCPWVLCCAFPVLLALCGAVLRCAGALALCCSCGACCCWRPVLWCAAVCCAVSFGVLWCGAGSGGPWLSAGAVLWPPALRFALLVLLVCVLSLCVRCCVALRVVLFGSGCICAVVGASCCCVSLCVVVSPWAFCGVVVPLWCVVVSCCAVRCPVVSCALCRVLRCCAALRCCAGGLCCAVVCAAGVCFSFCPLFLC